MTVDTLRDYRYLPGPLHATLLAGTVPLFLGALLSAITYYQTYQSQWSNFAAWLLAGGELFSGLALIFALVNLIRANHKGGRPAAYFLLLLVAWIAGLVGSFEHGKDAWAVMPGGLLLSAVATVLAIIATWIGLTRLRSEVL